MPNSILELIFKTSKQGQGGKAAAAELKELKANVGEVTDGLLGFNLGTLTAAGAVVGLGSAVMDSIKTYTDYADTVRQMSLVTGQSAEDTSRLIQLTDDLGVSQSTLETAMSGAAKKGIALSIDGLAKLADQYVSIQDPVQRNKLLLDNFGKSGLDMAAAMSKGGDAIRSYSAGVADNLVLSKKQVDAAREYQIALDNIGDLITGLKVQVGTGLLPRITAMTEQIQLNIQMLKEGVPVWEILTFNQRLYDMSLEDATEAVRNYINWDQKAIDTGFIHAAMMKSEVIPAMTGVASGWNALPPSMQAYILKADEAAAATEKMAKPIEDVQTALENLQQAQQSFGQGIAGQLSSQLEAAGLSPDQLSQALAQLDEQFGTTTHRTQTMKDWITNAVARYQDGNGINEFASTIAQIQNAFWSSDPGVVSATNTLQQSATAMISIGTIYVGNEMDYQTLLARLRVDLPGLLN